MLLRLLAGGVPDGEAHLEQGPPIGEACNGHVHQAPQHGVHARQPRVAHDDPCGGRQQQCPGQAGEAEGGLGLVLEVEGLGGGQGRGARVRGGRGRGHVGGEVRGVALVGREVRQRRLLGIERAGQELQPSQEGSIRRGGGVESAGG